jgi:hypothetical protein
MNLEMLGQSGIVSKPLLADLRTETDELIAIFTTSAMTAKRQMNVER